MPYSHMSDRVCLDFSLTVLKVSFVNVMNAKLTAWFGVRLEDTDSLCQPSF
jgi:hypothetical protein